MPRSFWREGRSTRHSFCSCRGSGRGGCCRGLGLPVVVDNPNVGDNLNDHQGINYTWAMNVPTYNDILRPWWGKLFVGAQYFLTGGGPLSKSINHGGGFFRTRPDLDRPNMQLYFQAFSTLIPRGGERPLLTPDPFSGLVDRVVELPAHLAGAYQDAVSGPFRASGDRRRMRFRPRMTSRRCWRRSSSCGPSRRSRPLRRGSGRSCGRGRRS